MKQIWALLCAIMVASTVCGGSHAATPLTAVFDLEFRDTSLEGELMGKNDTERRRLEFLSDHLRQALAASGRYELVDIAPVREAALSSNLQACGGCDRKLAEAVGAELAVTGVVQKVSNLILNINIYVRDVASGKMVAGHSADIRSNTDESWRRGLDWILKNRLLNEASEGRQDAGDR